MPRSNYPRLSYFKSQALIGALFILFIFMHFYHLGEKPLHHDEGVNASFMRKLIDGEGYRYDPKNYHGPNLYFFQLIPTWLETFRVNGFSDFPYISTDGLTPSSLRWGVALAGMLLLWCLLLSWPALGRVGAVTAFILAGFSPDLLYFSRYFIHETYVVLFTLGVYLSFLYLSETRKPLYLYTGILSATLLFCTKETSAVTFFILAFSIFLTEALHGWLKNNRFRSSFTESKIHIISMTHELKTHFPLALILSIFIWALFFSSFFSNSGGLLDSFKTYMYWIKEGLESGHVKPFSYYLNNILVQYELPLVLLSFVGFFSALFRNEKKGIYLVFWTLGTLGFYSLTPYKTPWLVINIILPMCLLSGYAVQSIFHILQEVSLPISRKSASRVTFILLLVPLIYQLPQLFRLAYKEYDNDKHPQVYAHTSRSIFSLLQQLEKLALESGKGKDISLNVFTDKYWPLPYYLMKYTQVHYYGDFTRVAQVDADLVLVDSSKKNRLEALLRQKYTPKYHSLRSGVPVVLFVNEKLTDQNSSQVHILRTSLPRTSPLSSGLDIHIYKGTQFQGHKRNTLKEFYPSFDYDREATKPFNGPSSILWAGLIDIPQNGIYKFILESDDGAWLSIDEQEIVDNGGEHARMRSIGWADLSSGLHEIKVRYFDIGGEAILKLYWVPPNGQEQLIPPTFFYKKPAETP